MLLTVEDLNLSQNLPIIEDINDLLEVEEVKKKTAELRKDKKMLKDIYERKKKIDQSKLLDLDDDFCGSSDGTFCDLGKKLSLEH